MKKIVLLILIAIFLSGCATYKYHHGQPPYDKGYVVSRDDYAMVEYTLGRDNTVPARKLAKQRFKRRKNVVEDYYKKMGLIENRFKTAVWGPWVTLWKLVGGIFRLPFIAAADYRYEHNPKYRERVKALEQEKEAQEAARVKKLKDELNQYVQKDMDSREPLSRETQALREKIHVVEVPSSAAAPEPVAAEENAPAVEIPPERTAEEVPVEKVEPQPEQPAEVKLPAAETVAVEKIPEPEVLPQPAETKPITAKQLKQQAKEEARLEAQEKRKAALARKEELRRQREEQIQLARERRFAAQAEKKLQAQRLRQEKEAKKLSQKEASRRQKEQQKQGLSAEGPAAVIIAQPVKGYSPLKVHFYGNKSASPGARIVSYAWDFGDGDKATRENPVNTYYSSSFEPRYFKVTLIVQDNLGNTSTAETTIEVLNK